MKRVLRIPAELKMQSGEFSLEQAIQFLIDEVPMMDENLARYDLQIYIRRPAYGPIPISLIRWEMTGLDDEVKIFWQK